MDPDFIVFNCAPNSVIRRDTYMDFLIVYDHINNSVFIINVVTVSCLLALHEIKPLNNLIINA